MSRYSDHIQKATLRAAKEAMRCYHYLTPKQREYHALVLDDIIARIDAEAQARPPRERNTDIADVMRQERARK